MNLITAILAVVRAGFPFPDWRDRAAFIAWLSGLSGPTHDVIMLIVDRASVGAISEAEALAAIEAECPEAWGDGRFLELLKQLLPIILQILPLFLEPSPAPEPQPQPTPPPVV